MMLALLLPEDHLLSDTEASAVLLAIRFVIVGSESGVGKELRLRATLPLREARLQAESQRSVRSKHVEAVT